MNSPLIEDVDRDFVEFNRGYNVNGKILAAAQVGDGHGNIGSPSSRRKTYLGAVAQATGASGDIDRAGLSLVGLADNE